MQPGTQSPPEPQGRRSRPRIVLWLATAAAGLLAGLGAHTFRYAKGLSYLSNDPAVCANCHVMQAYYDAWARGSHHGAAVCNDCHTPHDLIGKYMTKAENGYHHSKAFTLQNFHEPIRIREKNARIAERNCLRCHGDMVSVITAPTGRHGSDGVDCVRCHRGVGHDTE